MRNQIRKQESAVGLFGVSSERSAFERAARDQANAPQTAALYITTITPATPPMTILVLC